MAATKKTAASSKKAIATKKTATKKIAEKETKKVDTKTVTKEVKTPSPKASIDSKALFQRHERDTGSPEKQIELLSTEISMLQQHLAQHAKDVDAKRSLFKKVARRRTFLKYLKANKLEIYQAVSKKLGMKV
jgi:small subunit ribosomal protein S15